MSELQQQAVRLISGLSDDNIRFLIEIIRRLMPQSANEADTVSIQESAGIRAFQRLDAARSELKQYLPVNLTRNRSWRRQETKSMVVLIDTNVIIDFLIMREPFFEASSNVIRKCAEGELKGSVAFHSIPN